MNIWKLILIVLAILYLLAELAYRRWIRPDCGLSEAELDCVARAEHKNNTIEDLKKARWYLDRDIQRRERLKGKST